MNSFRLPLLTAALALLALPAYALNLQQGRASGVLGEGNNGYVSVIRPSPEAQSVAAEVNARRQQEYARISAQNGQPVEVVAKLAVPQIIQQLEPGSAYQDAGGNWVKK